MHLHVLTAITRPEYLPRIAESVAVAQHEAPDVAVSWHWRFDIARQYAGGQALKNAMLEQIADGWCWILDDDNLMKPVFLLRLSSVVAANPHAQMIVCAQDCGGGRIRRVHRRMLRETHVDAAQAVFRREAIGELRIPEHYCGDGAFIEALADRCGDPRIVYIEQPIVTYNALRDA